MTNATLTETIDVRAANELIIENRYARREDGIAVNLRLSKEDSSTNDRHCRLTGRIVVSWSARSARGWGKNYKATFNTLAEARAFADSKWEVCKGWTLRQPVSTESGGASAAFSAQVASMRGNV